MLENLDGEKWKVTIDKVFKSLIEVQMGMLVEASANPLQVRLQT